MISEGLMFQEEFDHSIQGGSRVYDVGRKWNQGSWTLSKFFQQDDENL